VVLGMTQLLKNLKEVKFVQIVYIKWLTIPYK